MKVIKNKRKLKERKSKTTFKPYLDVIPLNEVKRKLRPNIVIKKQSDLSIKKQFDFFDELIYKSDLFYLNMMIKLKKHSEAIWSILLLLSVTYLTTWFIKNI